MKFEICEHGSYVCGGGKSQVREDEDTQIWDDIDDDDDEANLIQKHMGDYEVVGDSLIMTLALHG